MNTNRSRQVELTKSKPQLSEGVQHIIQTNVLVSETHKQHLHQCELQNFVVMVKFVEW